MILWIVENPGAWVVFPAAEEDGEEVGRGVGEGGEM